MDGDLEPFGDLLIGQPIALAQHEDRAVQRRKLFQDELDLLSIRGALAFIRRCVREMLRGRRECIGVEHDRLSACAEPKFGDEVYGNAIQIGARLAYELRAFDAQESQVRFLREVLRMVSALQAAHQEAMELGVVLLVGAARDSLLPRRFRHSLRHSFGIPTRCLKSMMVLRSKRGTGREKKMSRSGVTNGASTVPGGQPPEFEKF